MTPLGLDCLYRDEFVAAYGQRAYDDLPDDAFLLWENARKLFDVELAVWELMPCSPFSEPKPMEPFGPRDYITHRWIVENQPVPVTRMN